MNKPRHRGFLRSAYLATKPEHVGRPYYENKSHAALALRNDEEPRTEFGAAARPDYADRVGRAPSHFVAPRVAPREESASGRTFPADRGKLGGRCFRAQCLKPGARWFDGENHYCEKCARMLNSVRPDSAREVK